MKIKLKIPAVNSPWPDQYRGKFTEVEVTAVLFPDGTYWSCEGFQVEQVLLNETAAIESPVTESPRVDMAGLFGARPSKLSIEFFDESENAK